MTRYGYFLSCEEYGPGELVRQARLAEQAGYGALWISDHFLDEVYTGQVGGEAEGFFESYAGPVLPRLREG
jgi:alkanesulfonate monooxygenase SsuD/methylene tetrahydromethanopterin reductase-like flavin-dependent oxidoreductase (luciferase family)